ncbi:SecY-interacting protein [Alteromonas sp. ASW11-19]|uniref:Protein Syd n=1 Tax=Alteromonas salexigens TaxID=2982530 RepID=A0ABT2VNN7_9ALTE|nr:SecY-interacting protein [Alteromonas salexigens]MCU7554913.1 SecY-interacting protein [Alteromonas salexigens]
MTTPVTDALQDFVARYQSAAQQAGQPLSTEYDSAWPSPCYQGSGAEGEQVRWQPTPQAGNLSFHNVEEALSISLNPQYCEFFTSFYSDNLTAKAEQGACELLQVWNEQDFERLQQNLIGHLLMKQRLKQAPTLFFAVTDEEDFILTVDNASGAVMLEQVGKPPQQQVADDLASFIRTLEPLIQS